MGEFPRTLFNKPAHLLFFVFRTGPLRGSPYDFFSVGKPRPYLLFILAENRKGFGKGSGGALQMLMGARIAPRVRTKAVILVSCLL